MAEWAARVFWSEVRVVDDVEGFAIALDDRPLRTPAKRALLMPTRAMAEAAAAEWATQRDVVDPLSMPVTRAANAAIDKVMPQKAEVTRHLAAYGETDLLCYRADSPEALAERQRRAWDPLLDWADAALGARLVPVAGVMPVDQPADALERLSARLAARDAFRLAALSDLITLSGSLVLGLAVDEGRLDPETAWDVSRIDERFQEEFWGRDDEAAAAEAVKRQAFRDAERFGRLGR